MLFQIFWINLGQNLALDGTLYWRVYDPLTRITISRSNRLNFISLLLKTDTTLHACMHTESGARGVHVRTYEYAEAAVAQQQQQQQLQ